jgi:hypothetical protein
MQLCQGLQHLRMYVFCSVWHVKVLVRLRHGVPVRRSHQQAYLQRNMP